MIVPPTINGKVADFENFALTQRPRPEVIGTGGQGWSAHLELRIAELGARSIVAHRRHIGPLYLQRAFYPEGPHLPHLYLLHPPGGLVGGDELSIQVAVEEGASALVTTPAAQKLYRSTRAEAVQSVRLRVAQRGGLEWLPAETIVFDGARSELTTEIQVMPGGVFLGWEMVCLGRTACGERFERGNLRTTLRVLLADELILLERFSLDGGTSALTEHWGFASFPVYGTLYCVPTRAEMAPDLAELCAEAMPEGLGSATAIDGVVVVRALCHSCEKLRQIFIHCWERLRPVVFGRPATAPRIWAT